MERQRKRWPESKTLFARKPYGLEVIQEEPRLESTESSGCGDEKTTVRVDEKKPKERISTIEYSLPENEWKFQQPEEYKGKRSPNKCRQEERWTGSKSVGDARTGNNERTPRIYNSSDYNDDRESKLQEQVDGKAQFD